MLNDVTFLLRGDHVVFVLLVPFFLFLCRSCIFAFCATFGLRINFSRGSFALSFLFFASYGTRRLIFATIGWGVVFETFLGRGSQFF